MILSSSLARMSLCCGVALVAGCAAVPDVGRAPTIAPPTAYAAERTLGGGGAAWIGAGWWRGYGDAQLDALIEEGLADAPDVARAAARVRAADAFAQQAGAARLPSLTVDGNVGFVKQSYNNGFPREFLPQGWKDTGTVTARFGFDLDLFGRNRAALAAARSDAEAARIDGAQAALMLSTAIADAYADLARLFTERAVQLSAIAVRTQTETLERGRVETGLDTQAELKQASAAVPAARSELASIDESIALTRNRLAALIGKGPDRGLAIAAPTAAAPGRALPAGLTAELIGRRPDIAAARARVEAAAARIRVARADFYPAVNLSALVGLQALGLENVLKTGSSYGNAGPAFSLPLFRGGELAGRYRGARADYDTAVADYDRTVADAYRDVADAVTSGRWLTARLGDAQAALTGYEGAYDVAQLRYQGGLSTFLDVLIAQDRVLQARRTVAQLRARALTLDVALVRALGGGYGTAAAADLGKDEDDG